MVWSFLVIENRLVQDTEMLLCVYVVCIIIILGISFSLYIHLTYIQAWGFVVPPTYEGLREANCEI